MRPSSFKKKVLSFFTSTFIAYGSIVNPALATTSLSGSLRHQRFAARAPMRAENAGVVEIDRPDSFDRVLAISDVHGMYDSVVNLLKASKVINKDLQWCAGKTLLIVIGDSIDKGPKSVEVMQLWIKLEAQAKAAGGLFLHLLGNHEAELLADPHNAKRAVKLFEELGAKGMTIDEWLDPDSSTGRFMYDMPLAAKVGNWLFVHSGYYPDMEWADFKALAIKTLRARDYAAQFIAGKSNPLEMKKWELNPALRQRVESSLSRNNIQGVVFGHQPAALNVEGASATSQDRRIIKIDNGMAPEAGSHPGSILEFSSPEDLVHSSAPKVQILKADGSHASIQLEQPSSYLTQQTTDED